MALEKLTVVLHNAHGVEIVKQMARLVYGFGLSLFVLSKPTSAAAQTGVPEVHRLAFKLGKGLLVVPDVNDALELIKPSEALFFVEKSRGELFSEEEVVSKLREGGVVAFFFSGSEPGFSSKELEVGKPVHLGTPGEIGCIGSAAIALHRTVKRLSEEV
ncbi:MAG: hypothetical protein DRJ98_04315 [Thermoprotei archaeon]|nr:MAG: hypothetical protein DRJ98_04315 [Thermoprotei archaeon]RLF13755.1 MAG: hypothetical protein DRN06_08165 [Thermoprotei archaeon]